MSAEDARARLVQKLTAAYAMGHGDGLSGGDGTKAGARKNAWIKYLRKHGSAAGYRKKKKTTKKSKTKKKPGRPRKVGRPKKSKTMTKSKSKSKKAKRHCGCSGIVKTVSGKEAERCISYNKPFCASIYSDLTPAVAKKIRAKQKKGLMSKAFLPNKGINMHGSGIVGGCDDCDGGILIDDYSGGVLVGEDYFSD